MAHRQNSSSGNAGGPGNHQPHLVFPIHSMQIHMQQQQLLHQQQTTQQHLQQQSHHHQPRHRGVLPNDSHQLISHHYRPRIESEVDLQRLEQHMRTSPVRPSSVNSAKSSQYQPPLPQPESWRTPIPTTAYGTYPPPGILHSRIPLSGAEDHSIREREREREEESKRAKEQVMKHFEDSFRLAQFKSAAQRYPGQFPSKVDEAKPRVPGIANARSVSQSTLPMKGTYSNMGYAPVGQTSPFYEIPGSTSKLGTTTTLDHRRPDIDSRGLYHPVQQQLGSTLGISIGMKEPSPHLIARDIERHSINNSLHINAVGNSRGNYPSYGHPGPVSRVKVSSPAPQQIYGKPNIPASNSPSSSRSYGSDSSPLSLTSKGPAKLTTTPPPNSAAGLPKHDIRSSDLANYYLYSSASNGPHYNQQQQQRMKEQFSPVHEFQLQPLDLGGKRKLEEKPLELDCKKLKNDESETFQNQVLNLVKNESRVIDELPKVLTIPSTTTTITPISVQKLRIEEDKSASSSTTLSTEDKQPGVVVKVDGPIGSPCLLQTNPKESNPIDKKPPLPPTPNTAVKMPTLLTSNSTSSPGIHKGKKAFLQRHTGQDLGSEIIPSSSSELKVNKCAPKPIEISSIPNSPLNNNIETSSGRSTPKTSASPLKQKRNTKGMDGGGSNGKKYTTSSESEDGSKTLVPAKRLNGKQKIENTKSPSSSDNSHSDSERDNSQIFSNSPMKSTQSYSNSTSPSRRGRKPRTHSPLTKTGTRKTNPFRRPAINQLKKSGESFLQDGSCTEVAPKLGKCRECRVNGSKFKKHSNIFCRFYAFRKLRYTKHGSLAIAGFSDPISDPVREDLNLWLPSKQSPSTDLSLDAAKFLIEKLGDNFCDLTHTEQEAIRMNVSQDEGIVAWKRVVQGVREICDVCDTSLFNIHWACKKCGFVVCIACYKGRKLQVVKDQTDPKKERDEFQWLLCSSRQAHEIESLILTQTVAGKALLNLGEMLHEVRSVWKIPQHCKCEATKKSYIRSSPLNVFASPEKSVDTEDKKDKLKERQNHVGDLKNELKNDKLNDMRATGEKGSMEVKFYNLTETSELFPNVPHTWLCSGRLLHLSDPSNPGNKQLFQEVWKRAQPVLVSNISTKLTKQFWTPESFLEDFNDYRCDLVNCRTQRSLINQPMRKFWEGFENMSKRLKDEKGKPMILQIKDWPQDEDFSDCSPSRFDDLLNNLPLAEYTRRNGNLNLASRLPDNFVKPDLGPKMCITYGSPSNFDKGTSNLHLESSDVVSLIVYVGVPKDSDEREDSAAISKLLDESCVDPIVRVLIEKREIPGALWHIYHANDVDKIRDLLTKVAKERGETLQTNHDPIYDNTCYLDKILRQRLANEYGVMGNAIVQFSGDALLIPAGAPYQMKNLNSCISINENFVSPENVSQCFKLTEELRDLSNAHNNHEDKLQIRNIVYHAVKDAVAVLQCNLPNTLCQSSREEGEIIKRSSNLTEGRKSPSHLTTSTGT